MASKTVWIVGGLVVAIGVVAYVAFKPAPATDASGTIVEAKRARADGTNSFNPSPTASTTDQSASDASKAMAGPDAAKDAAGAAGGSGDNLVKQPNGQAVLSKAREAADASKAATGDNSDLIKNRMASERAKASEAADAEAAQRSGPNYANQRPNQQATLKSSNNAPEMSKK